MSSYATSATSVLTSIYTNGLMPRQKIQEECIAGENDSSSAQSLCTNYFHPTIPESPDLKRKSFYQHQEAGKNRVQHQLRSLVFDPKTGMIPVTTERYPPQKFDTNEAFLIELSQRVGNTVCFILKKEAINRTQHGCQLGFGVDEGLRDVVTHLEYRTQDPIPPKMVHAILAPRHLAPTIEEIFTNVTVIALPDCKKSFELGVLWDEAPLLNRMGGGEPTETKFVELLYGSIPDNPNVVMPNYVWGLNQLNPVLLEEGFFTHIVRLPFECPPVKGEGEKKLRLTIKSTEPEKVIQVVKDPRFRLTKCYEQKPNQYYVVCDEKDVPALREIVTA